MFNDNTSPKLQYILEFNDFVKKRKLKKKKKKLTAKQQWEEIFRKTGNTEPYEPKFDPSIILPDGAPKQQVNFSETNPVPIKKEIKF